MSITFTAGSESFNIGGGSHPAPNFSVTAEPLRKDSLSFGNKYNITVTGTLIIGGDLTARETNRRNLVKSLANTIGEVGTLTIVGSNSLVFTDCILVSSEAAEQDDFSRGIQNQDYTLTFEAYGMTGAGDNLGLLEASESWEVSVDDGTYADIGSGLPQTVFTITQTVSATGMALGNSGDGKSGYIAAKSWVTKRVSTDPISTPPQDLSRSPVPIELNLPASYAAYNRISQTTQDILDGVYSVTTTWQTSLYPATSSIEFTFSGDETSDAQTVQVNITINGLSSAALNGGTIDKYTNAESFYNANIKPNIASWASSFYTKTVSAGNTKSLNSSPISTSRSDNRTDGVITITQSFDDKIAPFPGASSASLNITYNNEDGGNQIVAILPIIAKTNGPIIQNMQTTNERKRSIALDVTMNQANRITKPSSAALSYIQPYVPTNVVSYRENKTETWNPISGNYTLNVDFVWTDNQPTN